MFVECVKASSSLTEKWNQVHDNSSVACEDIVCPYVI